MQLANHRRLGFFVFASLIAIGCDGCGGGGTPRPKCAPVSGTVTYKNEPVAGATVTFWTANAPRAAIGQTDAKGNFQLTTFDPNDGAIVGTHSVTVTKPPESAPANATEMATAKPAAAPTKPPLPTKYALASSTPLKFEVKSGSNTAPLELTD